MDETPERKDWPDSIWAYNLHPGGPHYFGSFHSYEPPERQKYRKQKYLRSRPVLEHAEEAIELLKTAKLLVWQNSEVGDAAKTEIENLLATIEQEEKEAGDGSETDSD